MRISDWSSDVCASDLRDHRARPRAARSRDAGPAPVTGFPTSNRGRRTRGRLLDSGDVFSMDCPHAHALSRDRTLRHRQARSRQPPHAPLRSEEHTSELQSLMRISYADFFLKKQIISKSTLLSRTSYKPQTKTQSSNTK